MSSKWKEFVASTQIVIRQNVERSLAASACRHQSGKDNPCAIAVLNDEPYEEHSVATLIHLQSEGSSNGVNSCELSCLYSYLSRFSHPQKK